MSENQRIQEIDDNEEMTDYQVKRIELLARFYELQKAVDRTKDVNQKALLEEQKKELIDQIESQA